MSDFKLPDEIETALAQKGIYVGKTKGCSMQPMLVEGRDTVVIKKPEFPLKKYDVPVYHREDHYTLHRILRVTKKGYIISGDNRRDLEYDITDADIVGVLAAFYRGDEYIEYGDSKYMDYARRAARKYPFKLINRYASRIKLLLRKLIKTKIPVI